MSNAVMRWALIWDICCDVSLSDGACPAGLDWRAIVPAARDVNDKHHGVVIVVPGVNSGPLSAGVATVGTLRIVRSIERQIRQLDEGHVAQVGMGEGVGSPSLAV